MAGHSKWKNIQHRKGKEDAKKAKAFTKAIRELSVAAKSSPDPAANPRLRAAIDAAYAVNMPKDTVERAIKRGAGGTEDNDVEELTYEGYGAGGVAVFVECMTNNRNRTASEVRHAFSKCGGNLGTDGSVAFIFSKKGVISFDKVSDEDKLMEVALEAGAEDITTQDDTATDVYTTFEMFSEVKQALEQAGFKPDSAEVTMIASNTVSLDKETAEKVLRLIDMLEDLDDVQHVYSNADVSEEVMQELA